MDEDLLPLGLMLARYLSFERSLRGLPAAADVRVLHKALAFARGDASEAEVTELVAGLCFAGPHLPAACRDAVASIAFANWARMTSRKERCSE